MHRQDVGQAPASHLHVPVPCDQKMNKLFLKKFGVFAVCVCYGGQAPGEGEPSTDNG